EISDGRVLRLVQKFLLAGVMDKGVFQKSVIGTPQGGVISPLLANIVLHEFDAYMVERGVQIVRYADDAVLLCRTKNEAVAALRHARYILEEVLGLKMHPDKTRIVHISKGFEFLGYMVKQGQSRCRFTGRGSSIYAIPRQKSINKFKDEIRRITRRTNPKKLPEIIAELNPVIRGWGNYYRKAHVKRLFWRLDIWIRLRLYSFITWRWRSMAWMEYPSQRLYGEFKLVRLFTLIPGMAAKVS
ncbi:MAG: reverse transcriptase domain-containing protein, partial [Peptococcaceae bacterium]|nr:reverse transcriptase domain-containing protein [Peptococcaceae bacterium]